MRLALTACAATPELPEPAELARPARWAVQDMAKPKAALHPTIERRLRLAAFGALLAQDHDLLAAVLALVPAATRRASPQWTLHVRILAVAAPRTDSRGAGFAVEDAAVRAAFAQLLAKHRLPFRAIEAGDEGPVDAPFILGNYLHCWAWLSLFSPCPVSRTDWATMRRLMTG